MAGWLPRGRAMFLQRIHIFCTAEGLLSVMFSQRIWIVRSGWPGAKKMVLYTIFFAKHLYHPDELACSKVDGFVQIVFVRNLYLGEWLLAKRRQLFCQPSSNDLDCSDAMACSKEERPLEFLLMILIIWLGQPLPKRLFSLLYASLKNISILTGFNQCLIIVWGILIYIS